MKYYALFATLFFFQFSCTNSSLHETRSAENHSQSFDKRKGKSDTFSIQNPKEEIRITDSIADLYSGFWLNENFLEQVEKNASIYSSKEFEGALFGFTLKKGSLLKEKTVINGFSVHEGGLSTPMKWVDQLGCFTTTSQIEEYSYIQTPMDVELADINRIEFLFEDSHSEYYRKVIDDYTELRKILFKGSYTDKNGAQYTFSSDGKVTGMKNKSHYTILYDFTEGLNFDVIFISDNESRDNEQMYHYTFSNDTLRIYKIEGEVPEYSIGEMKYELRKI